MHALPNVDVLINSFHQMRVMFRKIIYHIEMQVASMPDVVNCLGVCNFVLSGNGYTPRVNVILQTVVVGCTSCIFWGQTYPKKLINANILIIW